MYRKLIVIFCVILISFDTQAFFLIKALKKAFFCSKVCYLYCRPKNEHVDIHHYHSLDIPHYFMEHYYDIPEHEEPKEKPKESKSIEPTYEDFLHLLTFYREHKNKEKTTEKPTTKEIYYYGHYNKPEFDDFKITTKVPYIYKDFHYNGPYHSSYKRETTTENSKESFREYADDEDPNEYLYPGHSVISTSRKYKRDLKHAYFFDIHHKHEFIENHPEKDTTMKKEEPSGICIFCMKKCHYPKPPD